MTVFAARLAWFLFGAAMALALIVLAISRKAPEPTGPAAYQPPRDVLQLPSNLGGLLDGALTSLYPLSFEKIPAPLPVGRAGALAAAGDHVLLMTREGALHALGGEGFVPLDIAPPFDITEQEAGLEIARIRQRMGVHDLIVRRRGADWELFASHPVHNAETGCLQLRVSAIVLPDGALQPGGASDARWRTVYTSEPCLDTNSFQVAMLGGGAMAFVGEANLIVGVGTFAATTADGAKTMGFLRAPGNHYGKLVEVDLTDGSARVIASGLRDPNGVVVEADGSYLTTEHGPRGGDELNRVREGLDYGWPISTYGTDYFGFSWPLDEVPGGHSEFEPPLFAWVPSIAVSTMIRIEGAALKHWKGDLLLGSLKAAHLYRVRLRGERVVLVEPILIGDRIRDVVETNSGEILVLLDRHPHVLRITEAEGGDAGVVGLCAGCHQLEPGGAVTGAGPSLVGLIGRPVAGDPAYAYSEALHAAGGVWTRDRLADFLENPQRFAPGTAMGDLDLAPFTLLDIVQWFTDRAGGAPPQ